LVRGERYLPHGRHLVNVPVALPVEPYLAHPAATYSRQLLIHVLQTLQFARQVLILPEFRRYVLTSFNSVDEPVNSGLRSRAGLVEEAAFLVGAQNNYCFQGVGQVGEDQRAHTFNRALSHHSAIELKVRRVEFDNGAVFKLQR